METKFITTVEFRYFDKSKETDLISGHESKTFTLGICDTFEDACQVGNKFLFEDNRWILQLKDNSINEIPLGEKFANSPRNLILVTIPPALAPSNSTVEIYIGVSKHRILSKFEICNITESFRHGRVSRFLYEG